MKCSCGSCGFEFEAAPQGGHRLLCGDATSDEDVARVLDGRAINVAFTSPPYAEQRDYDQASGFRPIHPDQYVEWFKPVAANVARHLAIDGSWFINIKPSVDGLDTSLYVLDLVIAHVREWGWHFATEFCWERNGVPKNVTQRFKNQFEPIYQFARGRWKMRPDNVRHESENVPRAAGPGVNSAMFGAVKKRRNGTTKLMAGVPCTPAAPGEFIGPGMAYPGNRLPTFTSSHEALGHAAAFPVGLPAFFCKAFADEGDVLFDPFCGTGSTLMAAEQSGHAGVGCELSPAYVDVTITRWQKFTGRTAVRDDGHLFSYEAAVEAA
jgi:site-specific DNA-methyltransferase (adenine-specific)